MVMYYKLSHDIAHAKKDFKYIQLINMTNDFQTYDFAF